MFILRYDENCPVCRSFAGLLSRKLKEERLELRPLNDPMVREFLLQDEEGKIWTGRDAVERLAEEFPAVKDFFWMLPDSYRKKAVVGAWRFGKLLRWLGGKKDCNC